MNLLDYFPPKRSGTFCSLVVWTANLAALSLPVATTPTPTPPPLLGWQSQWVGCWFLEGRDHVCVCVWVVVSPGCPQTHSWDLPAAGHSCSVVLLQWAEWLIHSWHLWGPWAHCIIKGRRINRNAQELSKPLALAASHTSLGRQRGQGGPQRLLPALLPPQPAR